MKILREDTTRTRGKLLAAAGEIFAEKGFRDATIAEICLKAGTNVAAVNYHFGSKEALYREAWRHAFVLSVEAHPPDGGVAVDAPPEERLQGQVKALLNRIADESNREFWFMQREFTNPTGLLEEVMRDEIRPLQQRTEKLVRELLGPRALEKEVRFCEVGIISQCINLMVVGRKSRGKDTGKGSPPEIKDIKAYADHVVKFSLAGIQAIRESAELKGSHAKHNKEQKDKKQVNK
jgi:AcrR family transcriptional regulator